MARTKHDGEKQSDRTRRVFVESLWLAPNAREHIDPEALDSLEEMVRQEGVLEQLLCRRRVNPDNPEQHHEVWDGQRRKLVVDRLRAKGHPIADVPARIEIAATTDAEMMILAAITTSGIGKEALTPVDEMRLVTMLKGYGLSQAEIARRLGKEPSWVSDRARLKTTTPLVQEEVTAGRMTQAKAQQLAGQPQEKQDAEARDSKAGKRAARKAAPARPGKKAIRALAEEIAESGDTAGALLVVLRWAAGDASTDGVRLALGLLGALPGDEPDPRQQTIPDDLGDDPEVRRAACLDAARTMAIPKPPAAPERP